MHYRDCLHHLKQKGDELLQGSFGLERISRVLDALDHPELSVPSVLIAGTNGKGSVARYLAAIAGAAGLQVGLLTSPHLVRLRERISIAGRTLDRHSFARHFSRIVEAGQGAGGALTFFETITATAFSVFQARRVDLAVLEVGLGGRLDATNVADPLVSVLTPISFDHQQYLGDTLAAIAGEKLGIARSGRPLVTAAQPPEAAETIERRSRRLDARLVRAQTVELGAPLEGCFPFRYRDFDAVCTMRGRFQPANAALAIEAALQLGGLLPKLEAEAVRRGVAAAFSPGVLQQLPLEPPVLLDGGHNPQAARRLAAYLDGHTVGPRRLLFGAMRDKDAAGVLDPLRPLFDEVTLTAVDSPRAARPEELARHCPEALLEDDPVRAYRRLRGQPGLLVVAGSFYLAGAIARYEGL